MTFPLDDDDNKPDFGDEAEDEADDESSGGSEEEEEKKGEGEQGSEEESEEDVEGEEKDEVEAHMVPKGRLDTKNRLLESERIRNKELEQKLQNYEKKAEEGEKPSVTETLDTQVAALETQVTAAYKDGDIDKVMELNKEIRGLQTQFFMDKLNESTEVAEGVATNKVEEAKLDDTVTALEDMFDVLNPDSDKYDQDTVDEVLFLKEALEGRGHNPSDAVLRAVGYVVEDQPNDDEPDKGKGLKKRETDIDKNLKAAKNLPPEGGEEGLPGDAAGVKDAPNAGNMTEEDFAALPESTLSRMRGDSL